MGYKLLAELPGRCPGVADRDQRLPLSGLDTEVSLPYAPSTVQLLAGEDKSPKVIVVSRQRSSPGLRTTSLVIC